MRIWFVLLMLIIPVMMAVNTDESIRRLLRGMPADIESYPYVAGLLFHNKVMLLLHCGGSILTHTAILSAAHCFYGDRKNNPSFWIARVGSAEAHNGGITRGIKKIHQSNFMNRTKQNDLAIVQTLNPLKYRQNKVMPITLAQETHVIPDNEKLLICGWGRTGISDGSPSHLQHIQLKAISNSNCDDAFAKYNSLYPNITSKMMCAGGDGIGIGTCIADSGNGVVHGGLLVGVVSWNAKFCNTSMPSVFTRVSAYVRWIIDTVSKFP